MRLIIIAALLVLAVIAASDQSYEVEFTQLYCFLALHPQESSGVQAREARAAEPEAGNGGRKGKKKGRKGRKQLKKKKMKGKKQGRKIQGRAAIKGDECDYIL